MMNDIKNVEAPTRREWRGLLGFLLTIFKSPGSDEGRAFALSELQRMSRIADLGVEMADLISMFHQIAQTEDAILLDGETDDGRTVRQTINELIEKLVKETPHGRRSTRIHGSL